MKKEFMSMWQGMSGAEVVACIVISLAIIGALVWLSVLIATLAVNYVLVTLGLQPVGMFFVWVCMFLLSWVGSYFRTSKVKVEQ